MALELSKLTRQVDEMGQALAQRDALRQDLLRQARALLVTHAQVSDDLRSRVQQARHEDASWRGADPVGSRLDDRRIPSAEAGPVTMVAVDGSQLYPDRHGMALYYVLNTGSIVLRQGSGAPPDVGAQPELFFKDEDLFDESGRLRDVQFVNRQRDRAEINMLARLAEVERTTLGGELMRPIAAVMDGPLLLWMPEQLGGGADRREMERAVHHFAGQLDILKKARAVPVGYVDRPGSSYVLRTLELIDLSEISRETLRRGKFRRLTDRLLFGELRPNERSPLFLSTSNTNERYARYGHQITFFYVNVARQAGPENALIARVELPIWAAADAQTLDLVHQALYVDCALNGYPYVLARAHELAVIDMEHRAAFESMVQRTMLRWGLRPATSAKARMKRLTDGR